MKQHLSIIRVAVATAAVVCAAVLAATAGATTGTGYQFVIGVRLTGTGVAFTRQQHVPRGSVVQFLITNQSREPRYFVIGGRKTKLLRPRQRETFFLGFDRRGAFGYRSWGPDAKAFHGTFTIT
jgi:hypothetical protein